MPRARAMEPDDRRAQLLWVARVEFARAGYHQTSVSDIIQGAGVARGTFYNYFDSKRAVFGAVLESVMDEVWAQVRPIEVCAPLRPQVEGMIRRILTTVTDPAVSRLLFTEAVGIDAEGDAALADFYARAVGRVRVALELGQRMGVVAPGDMELMARCILGLVKEPVFQAALAGQAVDVEALTRTLFELLGAGLFARGLDLGR